MSRIRRLMMTALAFVGAAALVLVGGPAEAATGPVNYTACVTVSNFNPYRAYGTAQARGDISHYSPTEVQIYAYSYGRTYDCGQHGGSYGVPTLTVTTKFEIYGTQLNTSVSTNGQDMTVSLSVSHTYLRVEGSYTLHNTSGNTVSFTPFIAHADGGGRIDQIYMTTTVTIEGLDAQASTSSQVRVR